jgi:ABC-type Fe3+/spermidine/putrescine transport system ATPase subunit
MSLGSRIAVANRGRIEQIGRPEEVYSSPCSEFVAEFMGMSNSLPVDTRDAVSAIPADTSPFVARFRPEDVRVRTKDHSISGDCNPTFLSLQGFRVVDRAFHGENVEYALARDVTTIKATIPSDSDVFEIGHEIIAEVARKKLSIYHDEATSGCSEHAKLAAFSSPDRLNLTGKGKAKK